MSAQFLIGMVVWMIDEGVFEDLFGMEWDFFTDPFFQLLGPVFPAIVAITLLSMSYIYTGGLAVPTTLSIFIGGFMIMWLPAEAQMVGGLLVLFGIFVALYSAYSGGGVRV